MSSLTIPLSVLPPTSLLKENRFSSNLRKGWLYKKLWGKEIENHINMANLNTISPFLDNYFSGRGGEGLLRFFKVETW
jgi:hypothetical protein